MSHKILLVILLLVALTVSPVLQAAVSDGTRISPETIRPWAKWVEQAMHVKMAALPIVTASGSRLKNSLGLQGIQQARSMAAYLPGQIIINNIIWDPDSLRSQSYIVHEMVHHAQLLSGRSYPCNKAKEREAYLLQNRWLQEQGEESIVSDSWIEEMSSCSRR